jgi:hypothetical protein
MEYADAADMDFDSAAIVRCRELLGDEADGLSDRDVDQIRQHAETMARVVVEVFLESRATKG